MPAYVVVHLDPERQVPRGKKPRERTRADVTDRLKRLAADHDGHLSLIPPDPGTSAASTVTIMVPDMERANALADALRELDDVDTAYSKPGEELP